MTDPDERLSELLSDAVSDIEPGSGLDSIRSRTKVTPMTSRRSRLYATGGAVLATAAVITAIAFASGNLGLNSADPDSGPAGSPSAPPSASDPTELDSTPSTPTYTTERSEAIYYVGDGPRGPRLFRYFEPLQGRPYYDVPAELGLLTSTPSDPDYRTLWPEGAFVSLSDPEAGIVMVTLADAASLRDRPAGMTEEEAGLAIEQVIYTVQAAFQERLAVQFRFDGNPIDQVYGVPTSEPLANAPLLETLSLMSITSPAEGEVVSGTFTPSGVANSFEATVAWQLLRGDSIVKEGAGMADGYMAEKLFPFKLDPIDVSGLEPGTYTFVARTDDPAGDGSGAFSDTRTIVVE